MSRFKVRRVVSSIAVSGAVLVGLAFVPGGPLSSAIAGAANTPTLTASATPNPVAAGSPVTVSADLEGAASPVAGDISWIIYTAPGCGGINEASGDVFPTANGVITLTTTSSLAPGSYYVDAYFASSDTSVNLSEGTGCPSTPTFVVENTTSLTLSATPNSVTYGNPVNFTATLSGGGTGADSPTGTIAADYYTASGCTGPVAFSLSNTLVDANGTYGLNEIDPPAGTYYATGTFTDTDGFNSNSTFACAQLLVVKRAPLSVMAPAITLQYGSSIPTLTPTYNGFVNGDTPASLTKQPKCVTTATSSSPPGTYPVTCSGAVDTNYTISYVAGEIVIEPASTSFTISDFVTTHPGGLYTAVLAESGLPPKAVGAVIFETPSGPACVIQLTGKSGEPTSCFANFGNKLPFYITAIFIDSDGDYGNSTSTNTLHPS